MAIVIDKTRRKEKASSVSGVIPTIPVNEDDTSGLWLATDIYERELFINLADNKVFTRVGSSIIQFGSRPTYEKAIVAHAGGGQTNAYILTKDKSRIDTCATDGNSVKMIAATAGMQEKELFNNT